MMNLRDILVCFFFIGIFSVSALPKQRKILPDVLPESSMGSTAECTHDNDCNLGECCVISPNRYSIPQCKKFHGKNESCRPIAPMMGNVTLGYPDGSQIHLKEVHYIFCPCEQGLTCSFRNEVCSGKNENNNQVVNLNDLND